MNPPDDLLLSVSRSIEIILDKIACAPDRATVFDLQQRAMELISGLPLAIDRARLGERVSDAVNARLQELET
jgi:hypothetical protein